MTAHDHRQDRPSAVTELARTVYDYERDNPALLAAMFALGWSAPVEDPRGGLHAAWWVEREGVSVLISFAAVGTAPAFARAAFWQTGGGRGV